MLCVRRVQCVCLLCLFFVLAGCSNLSPPYDAVAYQAATSLKVDALRLMALAETDYPQNAEQVNKFLISLKKAYEYANGRPKNELVAKQWEIMLDPERNLLGGFLSRWKEQGRLSQIFIAGAQGNVAMAFDQIIGLESGKIKPASVQ